MEGSGSMERFPQFVYYLWYPGVLGSMLYDLLQGPGDDHRIYIGRLLVTIVYSVDYIHLFHDLPTTTEKLGSRAPILDGLIALGFGLAAASLERAPGVACILLVSLCIAFLGYYSVRSAPYFWSIVSILALVLATLAAVYWLTSSPLNAFLSAMGVFAGLYIAFCFWVYPLLMLREA